MQMYGQLVAGEEDKLEESGVIEAMLIAGMTDGICVQRISLVRG